MRASTCDVRDVSVSATVCPLSSAAGSCERRRIDWTSPSELIAQQLGVVDTFMVGRVKDTDAYDALLGPSIGYVNGEGDVYSGTLLSSDGTPVAPGGITVLAATDGRLTVSVVVIVGSPDADVDPGTQQHAARTAADDLLKTFDWDTR